MTVYARQVSNLASSQRMVKIRNTISVLGAQITPCLSVSISWESITNPTSGQSCAEQSYWDYNGKWQSFRRKSTGVSPDGSMPSPEVMFWCVLLVAGRQTPHPLCVEWDWCSHGVSPLHIRVRQCLPNMRGGTLGPQEHLHNNSAVTYTLIFVSSSTD